MSNSIDFKGKCLGKACTDLRGQPHPAKYGCALVLVLGVSVGSESIPRAGAMFSQKDYSTFLLYFRNLRVFQKST